MSSSISTSECAPAKVWVAVLLLAFVLGSITTGQYVLARGIEYLETGVQIKRHNDILQGHAGNPWQYRVLAPFLVDFVIQFMRNLGVPYHLATAFIMFRVFQDTAILVLAWVYYRKLGISSSMTLLGMVLLAFGMGTSHFDSDLQFNTFFDVLFYLSAALCMLLKRFWLLVPVIILAAFNRETSGLIPFMLLGYAFWSRGQLSWHRALTIFVAALGCYFFICQWLRLLYPGQDLILAYDHPPGLSLFWYNFGRSVTWFNLAYTLNLTPVLALISYRRWPAELQGFFWTIVPVWLIVHAFGAVMAETRLLLVPLAVVFVPGTLVTLRSLWPVAKSIYAGGLSKAL